MTCDKFLFINKWFGSDTSGETTIWIIQHYVKCPNKEFFLVRIFLLQTEYEEILRIWTLFTQCNLLNDLLVVEKKLVLYLIINNSIKMYISHYTSPSTTFFISLSYNLPSINFFPGQLDSSLNINLETEHLT